MGNLRLVLDVSATLPGHLGCPALLLTFRMVTETGSATSFQCTLSNYNYGIEMDECEIALINRLDLIK